MATRPCSPRRWSWSPRRCCARCPHSGCPGCHRRGASSGCPPSSPWSGCALGWLSVAARDRGQRVTTTWGPAAAQSRPSPRPCWHAACLLLRPAAPAPPAALPRARSSCPGSSRSCAGTAVGFILQSRGARAESSSRAGTSPKALAPALRVHNLPKCPKEQQLQPSCTAAFGCTPRHLSLDLEWKGLQGAPSPRRYPHC